MKSGVMTGRLGVFLNSGVVVLSTTVLCACAVTRESHTLLLAFLFAFLAVSGLARAGQAGHVALFSSLTVAAPPLFPMAKYWPWTLLIPLAIYGLVVFSVPGLRRGVTWFRWGRPTKAVWAWMLVTIAGSAAALVGWYAWLKPDLSVHFARMPAMPVYLLPLAGLGFALLNAVMEEVAFRGILMDGLEGSLGRADLSLVAQAFAFGLFHYVDGFPNGGTGVLMTFVYGLMLGWVKTRSRGMLAPVIIHVFADLTIFAILAAILLRGHP